MKDRLHFAFPRGDTTISESTLTRLLMCSSAPCRRAAAAAALTSTSSSYLPSCRASFKVAGNLTELSREANWETLWAARGKYNYDQVLAWSC